MTPLFDPHSMPSWIVALLVIAVILAAMAILNIVIAGLAERRHPPAGSFLEVKVTRLHYSDRGTGQPVLLLHGNAVTGDDYNTSGVAEGLLGPHRVLIFDRPGFGYSERPRGRVWTAGEQADVIHAAMGRLGIERAVVVGHSWGTLVALALAERHPASTAGLVLLSGYYFPTPRLDALLVAPVAAPVLGDILRYTISPLFGWLMMPLMKRAMFAPAPVSERFRREYSTGLAVRPSQLRASAQDGSLMMSNAAKLNAGYDALAAPAAIIAGDADKVVGSEHARRLHGKLPQSSLRIVEGAGHMVHHVATKEVVDAIEQVVAQSGHDQRPLAANFA